MQTTRELQSACAPGYGRHCHYGKPSEWRRVRGLNYFVIFYEFTVISIKQTPVRTCMYTGVPLCVGAISVLIPFTLSALVLRLGLTPAGQWGGRPASLGTCLYPPTLVLGCKHPLYLPPLLYVSYGTWTQILVLVSFTAHRSFYKGPSYLSMLDMLNMAASCSLYTNTMAI